MLKLDTKHKKKSFIITVLLHLAIIFLLFYLGLSALDPVPESGIAVNFGTTITGEGNVQPTEAIKSSPKETTPEVTPPEPVDEPETSEIAEEIVTQEIEDAPVITKKTKKKPSEKKSKDIPKEKPVAQKPVETPVKEKPVEKIEEKKPNPTPDKSTLDILDSFSNGPKSDGKTQGGEGDDTKPGDKGDPKGNLYATSYYGEPGKGGLGNGVGYGLNGRGKASGSAVKQNCNEAGRVVVKIIVNRQGKVIQANPGVKGTTNSAACLLDPAKRTALTFKWKSDPNAPAKQIGFIEITFSLGE